MTALDIPPRRGSPESESATLDVLQAYDSDELTTTSPNDISIKPARHLPHLSEEPSPDDATSQLDLRLSAVSCSSTSNLVAPHHEKRFRQASEFKESPFRWNYPSLSELPIDQPDDNLQNISNKGKKPAMRLWEGWQVILFCSWFNALVLLIPVSWVLGSVMGRQHKLVFIFSILSMIPLVKFHDLSTRELALRFGGAKTGLLNASMSNTVELVVAITALKKCELRIVQSSLIGSILSKLLLILGMCFFAGGLRFSEQGFDQTATRIHSSLLSISVGALLLPAAYHFTLSNEHEATAQEQRVDILKMSHGVSIVLMFIYVLYLLFQLWSHRHLYKDQKQKSNRLSVKIPINPRFITERRIFNGDALRTSQSDSSSMRSMRWGLSSSRSPRIGSLLSNRFTNLQCPSEATLAPSLTTDTEKTSDLQPTVRLVPRESDACALPKNSDLSLPQSRWRFESDASTLAEDIQPASSPEPANTVEPPPGNASTMSMEPVKKEPRLSLTLTLSLLIVVTVLATFNAEQLVESMDGISTSISKQWVGLILLPAVSSVAECVTAMNVSVKDQLSLSVSVAVGSAIQVTLFIIPFMVTLGWIMNKPLTLLFDPFESIVLYVAVQTMSYVVADAKSNWFEGAILISLYVIIAVSFWYYPGQPSGFAVCVINVATDT